MVQVTGSPSSHGRKVKAGTVKKIPVAFIGQNKVFQENQANTVTLNDSRNFRGSLVLVHLLLLLLIFSLLKCNSGFLYLIVDEERGQEHYNQHQEPPSSLSSLSLVILDIDSSILGYLILQDQLM